MQYLPNSPTITDLQPGDAYLLVVFNPPTQLGGANILYYVTNCTKRDPLVTGIASGSGEAMGCADKNGTDNILELMAMLLLTWLQIVLSCSNILLIPGKRHRADK